MELADFTFTHYGRLLDATLDSGWTIVPVRQYLESEDISEPVMVLRHDVDRRARNAPRMAHLEAQRDVASTYYFRVKTFTPERVSRIENMGHEIGYHYEDVAKAGGDHEAAHERFESNLRRFREVVDVVTVAAHGSALSPHRNLDLWDGGPPIEEYDLLGEAYLSLGIEDPGPDGIDYVSDTHRTWRTAPVTLNIESTDDLIEIIRSHETTRLCVLAHPNRWAVSRLQLIERAAWDVCAETIKMLTDFYTKTSSDPAR